MPEFAKLRAAVESKLSPERFRHSLAVQKWAEELAALHGADPQKAAIAGLLHDICRELSPREQLKYLDAHAILIDSSMLEHPAIWHAVTGAEYLRRELLVGDEEILNAVRFHTTGRAGMTKLELVVYLADLTAGDRGFPGVERLRALAGQHPEQAVFEALRFTLTELVQNGRGIVPDALAAYEYYRKFCPQKTEAE